MTRRYPQASIMMYPKTERLLEKAMEVTGKHKAAALREAVDIGLEQLVHQHQSPSPNQQQLEDIRRKLNMLADIYERQGLLTKTEADQWRGEN